MAQLHVYPDGIETVPEEILNSKIFSSHQKLASYKRKKAVTSNKLLCTVQQIKVKLKLVSARVHSIFSVLHDLDRILGYFQLRLA